MNKLNKNVLRVYGIHRDYNGERKVQKLVTIPHDMNINPGEFILIKKVKLSV